VDQLAELWLFLCDVWTLLSPPHHDGVVYAVFGWDDALIYLAIILTSYAISVSMAPKIGDPKSAAFDDFSFPQADEGTPQAVVFGDCWSGDWCILALGNFETSPIRKDSGGGK